MAYEKTNWQDTFKDDQGNVTQEGTKISATRLNNMEDGIAGAASKEELQGVIAQLAEKVTKDEGGSITYAMASQDFREQITGGNTAVVGVDAVLEENIVDKQVSPKKTTFITDTEKFKGSYINYTLTSVNLSPSANSRAFITKVEPNTEYTIVKGSSNRFRFGLMAQDFVHGQTYPFSGIRLTVPLTQYDGVSGEITQKFKTNSTDKELVIVVSSISETPALSVFETAARYKMNNIKTSYSDVLGIEKLEIAPDKDNLFDGNYVKAAISSVGNYELSPSSFSAVVPLVTGKKYSINKKEESNRFRVATHPGTPSSGSPVKVLIDSNDTGEQFFEFVAKEDDRTLIIQVTSQLEKPKLLVSNGYRYLKNVVVKANQVEGLGEVSSGGGTQETYFLPTVPTEVYSSPNLPSVASSSSFNLRASMHSVIYAGYDELVTAFPDYVSKIDLGVDGIGNPIYEYQFKAPRLLNHTVLPLRHPKVILSTGVHGNEKLAVWATLQFFKELCNNPDNKEGLTYLKNNVDFNIIPVSTPSAYDTDNRVNHNGVNINRNFPAYWEQGVQGINYGGSAPLSEAESVILSDFYLRNTDAYYYIDFHNTTNTHNENMFMPMESLGAHVGRNLFNAITNNWIDRYAAEPPNTGVHGMLTGALNAPGLTKVYASELGIDSAILEGMNQAPYSAAFWDEINLQCNVDLIGNSLIELMRFCK